MAADINAFFRNATLRICGSLNIEEGLHACFTYLSQHLPGDRLYLERHEEDLSGVRVLARADAERGQKLNRLISLSDEAKAAYEQWDELLSTGRLPPVVIINRLDQEVLSRNLLEALHESALSGMFLPLVVEGHMVGGLSLLAEGYDRFEEAHARLFASLKEPFFVAMSNALRHEEMVKLRDRLTEENRQLHRELIRISGDEIIGADFGLRDVMQQVRRVAPTDSPVLLTGETGVGKDVIAKAIHLGSARGDGPFIAVNCGAIADSLIDSELFGHEKGAFTGALTRKRGRFERAEKGTILLDEIGEMPLDAQVRLLRVLQHREIERVGGVERIPVDIRVIAATHQDLAERVNQGRFREDLFFRLNVFPIVIPPLRERVIDMPALVQYFLERKAQELKIGKVPQLAAGAMDTLIRYDWPGNVRELENVLERAIILHPGDALNFAGLQPLSSRGTSKTSPPAPDDPPLDLDTFTAQHIRQVLNRAGGKIHGPGGAGELLGMNPNTLRHKMKKLGIAFRSQRRSGQGGYDDR